MLTARRGKIRHINVHGCTDAHSQFCIASSCSNIQMQILQMIIIVCARFDQQPEVLWVMLCFPFGFEPA